MGDGCHLVAWMLAIASAVAGPSIESARAQSLPDPIVCHPQRAEAVPPHPLLIWNHGRAHSAAEYKIIQAGWRRTCELWAATFNAIVYMPVRPDAHGAANVPPELAMVMAAIDKAKTLPDVDPDRIALMGHSRGGLLAIMAAVRRSDFAALVMSAVPEIAPHGRETVRLLPNLTAPVLLMVEKDDDEGGLDGVALFSRGLTSAGKEVRAIRFDRGGGHALFQRRDYWWEELVPFLQEKVRVQPIANWTAEPPRNPRLELPPVDPNRRKR
jgi:pimeloyl-ACP methyl ester carboxylesterase